MWFKGWGSRRMWRGLHLFERGKDVYFIWFLSPEIIWGFRICNRNFSVRRHCCRGNIHNGSCRSLHRFRLRHRFRLLFISRGSNTRWVGVMHNLLWQIWLTSKTWPRALTLGMSSRRRSCSNMYASRWTPTSDRPPYGQLTVFRP